MLQNALPDLQSYEFGEIPFKQLMQNRIYNVLIVCSNYDYYLLEEDGRIDEQIFNEYTALNLRYPPNFVHAHSAKSALNVLASDKIDLVITWLDTGKRSFFISKIIKEKYGDIPIVALSHYAEELRKLLYKKQASSIDFVFHWNGNVDIFLAIIKLVEDQMNADNDINRIGVKAILLVEDSLRFYSRYLPLMYRILLKQTRSFVHEGLNEHRSMMSKRGRPKILLAKNFEEGIALFQKYKENLLGVISDVSYYREGKRDPKAGFRFLKFVRDYDEHFPVLIQSSDLKNKKQAQKLEAKFLHKHSETLDSEIKRYITKYFSFGYFEFWDPKQQKVVAIAKDLKNFQKSLSVVSIDAIVYHAKRNEFSKWLQSRTLFPLAKLFEKIEYEDFTEEDQVRNFLIKSVRAFRLYRSRGVIAKFDRNYYDEYSVFSRIGEGALGGKGRGLAFIDSFLKRHKLFKKYKNISISIPRTVVLSTDVFDEFMEDNDLFSFVAKKHTDEVVLDKFISKPLPEWAIKDIEAFLATSTTPIAIRSSSVLEDSLYQPFAGIFATYMVPNTDQDRLLEMVSNAIKSVMASAFYKNSKAYIKITSHSIEESKMAVILQEVTGNDYEGLYYPNISGVARSINFYPLGDEKPLEGIANIALGLGEIIVGGGRTLRFSPYHPKKILQLSTPGTTQRETQKYFYGLDMNPDEYKVSTSEAINKRKMSLRKAKNHRSLKFVASTYDLQNDMIRPGISHNGIRVLSFDNILKYNTFPLPEILQDLLRIGQREMSNPIEIEFAINLDVPSGDPKIFSFLQIRPIVEQNDFKDVLPEFIDTKDTIIYAESALGNGKYKGIHDFVYVKPETFNAANTREIALAVEDINKQFENREEKYVLVGPGRWGSSDSWLGIPVIWPQISNAKVIVESGLDEYRIDPSQGTHFFQNLTSFKVGYLTINPFINDGFLDINYLNSQEAIYENNFLRHIRFNTPLNIVIEGKNNKAVIFKEGYILPNKNDIDIDESNSENFM
jgi:hypothetical protein